MKCQWMKCYIFTIINVHYKLIYNVFIEKKYFFPGNMFLENAKKSLSLRPRKKSARPLFIILDSDWRHWFCQNFLLQNCVWKLMSSTNFYRLCVCTFLCTNMPGGRYAPLFCCFFIAFSHIIDEHSRLKYKVSLLCLINIPILICLHARCDCFGFIL